MSELSSFLEKKRAEKETGLAGSRQLRDEWIAAILRLYNNVWTWMEDAVVEGLVYLNQNENKRLTEATLGEYEAPVLIMEFFTPGVKVYVEPVARFVVGGTGRLDIHGKGIRYKIIHDADTDGWYIILPDETGAKPFIRKPFAADTLAAALEIILR